MRTKCVWTLSIGQKSLFQCINGPTQVARAHYDHSAVLNESLSNAGTLAGGSGKESDTPRKFTFTRWLSHLIEQCPWFDNLSAVTVAQNKKMES